MTRRPPPAARTNPPADFDLRFAEEDAALRDLVRVSREAFGERAVAGEINVARQKHTLRGGGRYVVAYDHASGEVAGAGAYMPPQAGVTEIVGIAVATRFRRRRLAQAITDLLAREAFSAGCTMTFLSAAGDSQAAIYARAGFVARTPMLFISKPAATG